MIELKNVKKTYNSGKANEFEALRNINFKVNDGELVAIIGKSGAGKSTLLHIAIARAIVNEPSIIFFS